MCPMARMLRSTTVAGTILLAAGLALAGCAANSGMTASSPPAISDDEISAGAAAGTWGDATDSAQPSLELEEDGTLTGTDGCNQLSGQWIENGVELTFENVASTMMACPDADTWLSGLDTAGIDGSTMTVYDESGDELGTLERTDD